MLLWQRDVHDEAVSMSHSLHGWHTDAVAPARRLLSSPQGPNTHVSWQKVPATQSLSTSQSAYAVVFFNEQTPTSSQSRGAVLLDAPIHVLSL